MKSLDDLAGVWPQLSGLLDEALSLPPEQRDGWLKALPPEHAALADTLQRLLGASGGVETDELLATLPRLDGMATGPAGRDPGSPQPGDEVGPYTLVRELGRGGMGSVWLAERTDGQLRRPVALKLPRLAWAESLVQRMARERDILASLEHPRIARLYDAGVDGLGRPWLAMEVVQGQPINTFANERSLSVRQRVALLLQVCEAVAYAHSRLVIHRDLKPGNIFVTDGGEVRLLDFGIARLVRGDGDGGVGGAATALTEFAGSAMTLHYASPEQVSGQTLTTATDVYSLGVVAFELLAGAPPYRLKRGSAAELEEAVAQADVQRASDRATDAATRKALRGDLDAVLGKALKQDLAQRYASVAAFADDLRRHLAQEPVLARPDSWGYRAGKRLVRYRWPFALSGVAFVSVLAAAVAAWQQAQTAEQERDRVRLALETNEQVQEFVTSLFAVPNPPDVKYIDEGLARIRAEQGKVKDAVRARMLLALGDLYLSIGRVERAGPVFREAADLATGARDFATAAHVMALQSISEANAANDASQALRTAERGMALAREHAAGDARLEARLSSAFTVALTNLRRLDEAMPYAQRAVALHSGIDGPGHVRTLAARGDVARLLHRAGQRPQAEAAYRALIGDMVRELGQDHPVHLMALENLGSLLAEMDQHAAAEATLRDAIAVRARRFGPEHPTAAAAYSILGRALLRAGRPIDAADFLERALALERQADNTPGFFKVYLHSQLVCASFDAGRHTAAEAWRRRGEVELGRIEQEPGAARQYLHDAVFRCLFATGRELTAADLQTLAASGPWPPGSGNARWVAMLQAVHQSRTDPPAAAGRLRDEAARLTPADENVRPLVLMAQARVARRAGDSAGAHGFYAQALQQSLTAPRCVPRFVPAAVEWADLLAELGRDAERERVRAWLEPCAGVLAADTPVWRAVQARLAR